ncbi:FtsX-like permease family protein [Actinoplanes sp. NPDC051494]|uniref:FtsX-like permease family protein n=1 Tax=Actinoplanes sp. NPDC051494 TaxID=3363907 RepID=UPI003797A3FA
MSTVLRRIRAYSGHLGLSATLALAAALLAVAAPRLVNDYTDGGLRGDVSALPWAARDLSYTATPALVGDADPQDGPRILGEIEKALPAPVPGFVEDRWFVADTDVPGVAVSGPAPYTGPCRPSLRIRHQSGSGEAVTVVEGRSPASRTVAEAMVSRETARLGGLRVGTRLDLADTTGGQTPIRVVGIFEPRAATAPFWDGLDNERLLCPIPDDGFTFRADLLTDAPGALLAGRGTGRLAYHWRFRLATQTLTVPDIEPLITAVVDGRRTAGQRDLQLSTGLDGALEAFDEQRRSAEATVAIVGSGLAATVLGLLVLAALLMADRRREEFTLLRARGATAGTVGLRTLAETAVVTVPAVLAGWFAATWFPGRPGGLEWVLIAAVLVLATGVGPVVAARSRAHGGRVVPRFSARRVTVEVSLLLLAVLGVVLVRRRGLQDGVDPFLSVVPLLLGAAAALLVVRLIPWPLRQAVRLAARGRGLVAFLGLARAGRGAPLAAGPVAVLIVATATGVFTAAVSTTIGDARDDATDLAITADAQVTGFGFAPDTGALLTRVPGVTAAVPMLIGSGVPVVGANGRRRTQDQLVVVDGAAANAALARRGDGPRLPGALGAGRDTGPIPAVVSSETAALVGTGGTVSVQGQFYPFRVAAVTDSLPGLGLGGTRHFIALPWNALPVPAVQPLVPTRYLIAGEGFGADAVLAAADAGQREYYLGLLRRTVDADATEVTDAQLPRRAAMVTWEQYRHDLQSDGVNALLGFVFTGGAAGSVVLALLAVGLAVLADAPGRGRSLSRLRTLGLTGGQGRNLLVLELAPLLAVAFVAGTAVGWALPRLIGAALGLDAFTAGMPARVGIDPLLLVGALGLLVAGLVTAVTVESAAHRRMRLGESLRLGEEN